MSRPAMHVFTRRTVASLHPSRCSRTALKRQSRCPPLPSLRSASTSTPHTNPSPSPRKTLTLASSPSIPWSALSTGQKAARTTEQTFNFGLILLGAGLTAGVTYLLWTEVFSGVSKTAVFNRAVSRVREDARCIEALVGDGRQNDGQGHESRGGMATRWADLFPGWLAGGGRGARISAFGENSGSRWARNRFVASGTEVDKRGTEHLRMHFYVAGPKAEGTAWVHMVRQGGKGEWEWWKLSVDLPGRDRLWLEDAERKDVKEGVKGGRMFGVKWF